LVLTADTLRADPKGDIGEGKFDRWHTFWVRAVDNEGSVDQTPAKATFSAYTKAPQLWLTTPLVAGQTSMLPSTYVINWEGFDDIGTGNLQKPLEARWVLKAVQLDGGGQPIGYPDALYDLAEAEWSAWASWGAADSTGRETVFRDQLLPGAMDSPFVVAVQARDDAGAITPQFDKDDGLRNNYGVFIVSDSLPVGPHLRVHVRNDTLQLGSFDFRGSKATSVEIQSPAGSVSINWDVMTTKHYGANPGEYRFAWNIVNPDNDDQWSAWGAVRVSPPHTLVLASEELQIQGRDRIGLVTTAIIRIQQVP
jgi:hypothetical protein